jgi:hypothetical protein
MPPVTFYPACQFYWPGCQLPQRHFVGPRRGFALLCYNEHIHGTIDPPENLQ